MYKFEKILACLDLSNLDPNILTAASMICKMGTKQITFINVLKEFSLPEEMKREFPDILKKAITDRREELQKEIDKYFENPGVKVDIQVSQGQPAKEILKYAGKNKIDLILSGRDNNRSTVVRGRLARRADCPFWGISPEIDVKMDRILIPIDFSEHSKMALNMAINISEALNPDMEIFVQNVYQVPSGYHYTGKSYDEFARVMEENATKQFKAFIKKIDTKGRKITPIYSLEEQDRFIETISEKAEELKADLIIIGAKGQTSTSAIFIGSKAERLVVMPTKSSMLMARRKGEKAGFKDFLQEL